MAGPFPTVAGWGKKLAGVNNTFAQLTGSFSQTIGATEAPIKRTARIAGTFSNFGASVDANGTARSLQFRVNLANGAQNVAFTDSTAQIVYDKAHTDHVAAGDSFDINYLGAGATPPINYWGFALFKGDTVTAGYYAGSTTPAPASNTNAQPLILGGGSVSGAASAATRSVIRAAGTVSNLHVNVTTASNVTASFTSEKNAVAGALTVSLTTGVTGIFEDTTHSDTLAAGDTYGSTTSPAFGTTAPTYTVGLNVTYASNQSEICSGSIATTASASNQFLAIFGGQAPELTTEAPVQAQLGINYSLSKYRLGVQSNTATGTTVFTLRKNGASGTVTVSVGAAATGNFEDTTHTDTFLGSDLVNYLVTGGTSGVINALWSGLLLTVNSFAQPPFARPMRSFRRKF
jgi:hypothetical protein